MKFLREPLVQFLLIGAALFAVFTVLSNLVNVTSAGTIIITPNLIENLKLSYLRSAGQPPSQPVLDELIQDYIREEIFAREGSARNFENDNPIIRGELRARMESFYEDTAQTPPPTDDQLRAYLEQHPKDFAQSDGHTPELTTIHQAVQDAWIQAQRKQAVDAAYQKLRARYTVDRLTPNLNPISK